MLKRSTISLGLMLTGSLAAAVLVSEEDTQNGIVVAPRLDRKMPSGSAASEQQRALPTLQLDKLARAEDGKPQKDPFTGKSWYVPPLPPAPPHLMVQEPPRPTPPPLPFSYMGRMLEEDGHVVIYLSQGSRAYSVSPGDTIDGIYRLKKVSSTQLALTYLPLDINQIMNIGSVP